MYAISQHNNVHKVLNYDIVFFKRPDDHRGIPMNTAIWEPLVCSVEDAMRVSALGRTFIYQCLNDGSITSIKRGKRRLIQYASLKAYLCAVTSSRNNALNNAAHALGTLVANGSLNEADAFSALFEAATMNGYTQKPDCINRATKTIYSGLSSGKAKPRLLPSQTVPAINPKLRASIVAKNCKTTVPQAAPVKRSVELVRMAEVVEKPITWLWTGYVPLGKLTLLAGAGGTGKSTLVFSIASIVTTAGTWPDATRCNVSGNALIWSSEDDPADVIEPRLLAINADTRRVGTIRAVKTLADGEIPFDPARDMDAL